MKKNIEPYELLDSGQGRKLERFGPYTLSRPCGQAVWDRRLPESVWEKADATFSRDDRWIISPSMPKEWEISIHNIAFCIRLTDFGHTGIFAEQIPLWQKIAHLCSGKNLKVLNLFAYSGGSTLAAAQQHAQVCHLDASKGMVDWARKNATINNLSSAPIRWIVEDAVKFLTRETRRDSLYDGIILDPPSFGRGNKGEVFKIEDEIVPLLSKCRECLSENPTFLLLSSHTPGFTPITLKNLLDQTLAGIPGTIESAEMTLQGNLPDVRPVPSGSYALWSRTP